jgi:hypothetical protein
MKERTMRKQKGLTLSGFMLWAVIVVIALLLGFKLAPPYMEYQGIQKLIKSLADDPGLRTGDFRRAIGGAFSLRAGVDNITSIGANDLVIKKDGEKVIITADYSVRVPLVGNINACIDFSASTEK